MKAGKSIVVAVALAIGSLWLLCHEVRLAKCSKCCVAAKCCDCKACDCCPACPKDKCCK